ncbi:glycosyltransferase family 4 protein [Dyella amyloliquefaciens]|uniref:glycosyltransferase family 4 protein n=1 Tax=Dyella amyloliquefaciens TaxID=1770545 RepID=UPI00102EB7EB|nr:glycosyltransferase family 4 protein [Dyella amyloliquefaciens]
MHVAQINFVVPPLEWGPDEVFHHWPSLPNVAEAVCASGTRVSVIQLALRSERVERHGVDYRFASIDGAKRPVDRGHLVARLLEALDVDVIHVNGLGFAEETFALAGHLPQVPIVLQDHANRPPRWWRRPLWRRWYGVASGVAFTALEQARPFIEAGLFGTSTPLFAIPESSSHFTPGSQAQARLATGLYGDPCVLWVGHLNRNKDPLTMLEGIAQAVPHLPELHLWCAFGSAPLMEDVRRCIDADARLAGRVHLMGKVAHALVESLMRAADLYISASHVEGSGYALLEAMACGVRPVVTDIPSFRAFTANGTVGHLWPRGDASALAAALIRAGTNDLPRDRVRAHFDASLSFDTVGRLWTRAYAQVIQQRWRRAS